jgi:hypothetical protein
MGVTMSVMVAVSVVHVVFQYKDPESFSWTTAKT